MNDRKLRRKVRLSYAISTVSIAMVLFLLGSASYLILSLMNAADRMRESVAVHVMLHDMDDDVREAVGRRLTAMDDVKEITFVSKDDAVRDFIEYAGDDFTEFLDFNPLPDSFEVRLRADGDRDALRGFERTVGAWTEVREVVYQRAVAEQIGANLTKFRFVLLVFGFMLMLISIILLNNMIRVSIYSKRYLISTMKLVGADRRFILRPFLASSVRQGIYAALMASVMFVLLVAGIGEGMPEIRYIGERTQLLWIIGGMFVMGMLISVAFTMPAVDKFVRMRTNAVHLY
ncbi:MAG: permease-like cell division protein FtsX [Rikenellaceae bacterium]|nr:permease-like cell division protein FtsX [Rikenellaceae bacterium]MCL2692869.1 permease-like cell division protein FtsX [Rikenellaceae bacterium]